MRDVVMVGMDTPVQAVHGVCNTHGPGQVDDYEVDDFWPEEDTAAERGH